jgi:hypothetical protein
MFTSQRRLADSFLASGLGVEDQRNFFRNVPISHRVIYFRATWSKKKCVFQNEHLMNLRQQIPDTSPAAFLDFLARRILLLS